MQTNNDLFRPTMSLRWAGNTLQQLWTNCNTEEQQWRVVETFKEEVTVKAGTFSYSLTADHGIATTILSKDTPTTEL
jgi:hypothetical protein